jgi:four helix bundle protein
MPNHKELDAWKVAIDLAKDVYKLTSSFPSSEMYGLVSQMKRSAVSIASNIAEGAARNSDKEFIHFLYVALGSIAELETQYILSKELSFTEVSPSLEANMERVRKLTVGLIKYLKNK